MSRSHATIPLTCRLAYECPSSNEVSKKNGTVRGDCILCDALLFFFINILFIFFFNLILVLF